VCGSRGRLAFIARASFRLHPLPRAARTLVVETDDAATVVARLSSSQLQPSALDVLHPGRVAVLFEGSDRAVDAQLASARALVGGAESGPEVWEESRTRQAAARGRVRFTPGELTATLARLPAAIVRPSSGVAYVPDEVPDEPAVAVAGLIDAIRTQLDPQGVLA
jgi:glycolate oxidase FAD binding subunit